MVDELVGVLDFEYPDTDSVTYCLKNTVTNMYFGGFSKEVRNKPLWVDKENAAKHTESDALRIQRRLETQYLPYTKIIIEEIK